MSVYRETFVSHAHADNDLCDRYVAALRARGIDVWYDRDNAQSGYLLSEQIEQELSARSAFVLMMTEASLKSPWVKLETNAYRGLWAKDQTRLMLAVRIGPCQPPPMINALLWIDAQAMPFDKAVAAIAAALATSAAPPSPTPPIPQPRATLPPLGPAPAPTNSTLAHHLTPMPLYNLGFRGYSVNGVECILPPICPVPGGVFTMGSDKLRDKEVRDNETPQYPVEVDAFAIGQHPVTVAEYACAVRANAVREPQTFIGVDWTTQQQHSDHPVVCVSWKDALAYVRWLAKVTRQGWRLPSEAEWEKAARGSDGRIYPWGDAFDKARCNIRESGVGTTTSVGRYPNGESPCHAQDMAGNVWEWTSSLYQPYPYRKNDGRENLDSTGNRTLRGGSWYLNAVGARAAYRLVYWPGVLGDLVGVRLALAAGSY